LQPQVFSAGFAQERVGGGRAFVAVTFKSRRIIPVFRDSPYPKGYGYAAITKTIIAHHRTLSFPILQPQAFSAGLALGRGRRQAQQKQSAEGTA
jgi:hypothetical protein